MITIPFHSHANDGRHPTRARCGKLLRGSWSNVAADQGWLMQNTPLWDIKRVPCTACLEAEAAEDAAE